jgi:RNA polymerase sigma-54 factor
MQETIDQIKLFDPVGVGAHDAQECLLLQIQQKESTPSIELARSILSRHFDAFSNANFNKLKQRLLIDDQQLHDAIKEIKRLNPKPSSAWQGTREEINREIIIPDFIIENLDDVLIVSLNNSDIPSLRVSNDYIQMLDRSHQSKSTSAKDDCKEIKKYIDSARNFIDAIRQRNETMMRAMQALVQLQREFFLQGDSMYLKPMVLKDIADITKYDVSTISRTFNNKYVQTEHGIIPLKFFFSEAMTNESGETISTRETKQRLLEIVNKEDKTHPLTDDELQQAMHQEGYIIARRTVAKYREQLNIPVARLRKKI